MKYLLKKEIFICPMNDFTSTLFKTMEFIKNPKQISKKWKVCICINP